MEGAQIASRRGEEGDIVCSAYRLGLGFVWARCSRWMRRRSERRSKMSAVHQGETYRRGRRGSAMEHAT